MFRKLCRLARPYRREVGLLLVLQGLVSVLNGVGLSALIPLLDVFSGEGSGGASGGLLGRYAALFPGDSAEDRLKAVGCFVAVVFVCKNGVGYAAAVYQARLGLRVQADLQRKILRIYAGARYPFFSDRKQGKLVNDLINEPKLAGQSILDLAGWSWDILNSLVLVGLLFLISWQATLAAGAAGLGIALGMGWFRKRSRQVGEDAMRNRQDLMAAGSEMISGIREVKLFGMERGFVEKLDDLVGQMVAVGVRGIRLAELPGRLAEAVFSLCLGGGLVVLAFRYGADIRTVLPALGGFLVVSVRLAPAIISLNKRRLKFHVRLSVVDYVLSMLETTPPEGEGAGNRRFGALRDAICFEDVTFAYGRCEEEERIPVRKRFVDRADGVGDGAGTRGGAAVLDGIRIEFERGKTTALVGPSGCGKSTIADLLVRLYEPGAGRILVDGTDVRAYSLDSWRGAIGVVSQDAFIFNGSIEENIAFGAPDAPRERVVEAARLANAHEFIASLPRGYDTVVGDRGVRLSGGQRQRLAIARAILRQPQILILDEATSALDTASEALVQAAIDRISRDRTVIVIAHRLSTIVRADKIVVLDGGRVAEEGTHSELLLRRGVYRRLYAGSDLIRQPA